MTAELKNRVRNNVHQTDVTTAVNEAVAAPDKLTAKRTRRFRVVWAGAVAGAGKHTDISIRHNS
jgi:hypothetical protein